MAKFSFKEVASTVFEAKPEGLDPINFTLRPINADTMLYYYEFETTGVYSEMLRVKLAIATQRITGWKGIEDENGELVPYTADNLFKLLNHKDFLPYMFLVGDHTIEEIRKAENLKAAEGSEVGKPKKSTKATEEQPSS